MHPDEDGPALPALDAVEPGERRGHRLGAGPRALRAASKGSKPPRPRAAGPKSVRGDEGRRRGSRPRRAGAGSPRAAASSSGTGSPFASTPCSRGSRPVKIDARAGAVVGIVVSAPSNTRAPSRERVEARRRRRAGELPAVRADVVAPQRVDGDEHDVRARVAAGDAPRGTRDAARAMSSIAPRTQSILRPRDARDQRGVARRESARRGRLSACRARGASPCVST